MSLLLLFGTPGFCSGRGPVPASALPARPTLLGSAAMGVHSWAASLAVLGSAIDSPAPLPGPSLPSHPVFVSGTSAWALAVTAGETRHRDATERAQPQPAGP